MQFSAKVFTAFRLKLIRKRKQSVASPPFREAVKSPLLVPVLRDRLLGELCDGQPIGFDPREDRLDNVRGKAVQGKDAGDVAGFQAELL